MLTNGVPPVGADGFTSDGWPILPTEPFEVAESRLSFVAEGLVPGIFAVGASTAE